MLVTILIAGFPADALFAGVIISNSVIGIIQEIKARRTLNNLSVLTKPHATVLRDGVEHEIPAQAVVPDDVLCLKPGNQVVVDGEVIKSEGLEINEALLTGERNPVSKISGQKVLSGSFVSSGTGLCRTTGIGSQSYAAQLAEEAKRFKLVDSKLNKDINKILHWLTVIILPVAILLCIRLLTVNNMNIMKSASVMWQEALRGTVAASVAMVPDGLVLLTSVSFLAGVIVLAKRQALAKELASVELLARVDTLCLDKTGTITTGALTLERIEPLSHFTEAEALTVLHAIATNDPAPNETMSAIHSAVTSTHSETSSKWIASKIIPFSSIRRWSATEFEEHGIYHLGAPDVLLSNTHDEHTQILKQCVKAAKRGVRVLILTRSALTHLETNLEKLPDDREPVCLIHLVDEIRDSSYETFAFFRDQNVDIKVISGDHPATVAAVAERVGIVDEHATVVDGKDLPEDPQKLADMLETHAVFGRVRPHQKQAMMHALQSKGRTVAMTGDGVNDVLALKDADMGIAMSSGASATRAVANLVLLNNDFSTLPHVLSQSRQVINNIERVANLFVTKTVYAVLLTLLVAIAGVPFPLLPRHLTVIGTFSTGVPGFFLALSANNQRVNHGFLARVLRFSLPAGVVTSATTFVLYQAVHSIDQISLEQARTCATITLLCVSLVVLLLISRPLLPWKLGLAAAMATAYLVTMLWDKPRSLFQFDIPSLALPSGETAWMLVVAAVMLGGISVWLAVQITDICYQTTIKHLRKGHLQKGHTLSGKR